uniref:Uncharacterized protein n=1 Tax=Chondria sp. (in: red algae) TaxID=1982705 RepID=A0A1Z1MEH6_9FLOR|nr:hypothetical protein [Chondria sp. (in: red algae)]
MPSSQIKVLNIILSLPNFTTSDQVNVYNLLVSIFEDVLPPLLVLKNECLKWETFSIIYRPKR